MMPAAPRTHQPRPASKSNHDRYRGTAAQRGYDSAWSEYSKNYRLQPEHAVCELCKRRYSECVDHVLPHAGNDDPLFWDAGNHWALCWKCHSWKTARFDGGYGRSAVSAVGIEARKAEIVAERASLVGVGDVFETGTAKPFR